ncbi:MAG TPA: glycosyltransferase, partial [Labilithrix sp.]|jgi:sterol 3beta-glucosyltransferase|nr:glycosyltransferase [Labilithrix sp.]
VLATGWGGLSAVELPPNVIAIESAPHDWLFPRIKAVVHHGGAGSTMAGLRAGKPTVICPFFGDQPFWGNVVRRAGLGPPPIPQKKLSADRLATAIREALADDVVRRTEAIGECIRAEDGPARAAELIERGVNVSQKNTGSAPAMRRPAS